MTICILGRQSKLCLAELESLYGAEHVQPIGDHAALIDHDIDSGDHLRLGGTVKVAKLLIELPTVDWGELMRYCEKTLPQHLDYLPEGKMKLGLSAYGVQVKQKSMQTAGLNLKKIIKQAGRSVRVIPNTEPELSSAQVLHNQLTSPLGMELLFIRHGDKTYLGQTRSVQNIDDYSFRDFKRPQRDAFVGMLPPKLAQIMINLALGSISAPTPRVLDPFCGTGVVLQEAVLLGYPVYGADISEKMVRYTRDNLNWIRDQYKIIFDFYLEVADAATHTWQQPIDTVVTETYLGQPLSGLPAKREKLYEIIDGCNTLNTNFLKNLYKQLKPGTRICIAVPAWNLGHAFKHLQLVDHLEKIGYNRVSFAHADNADLIYHRTDQIVARELLVLTRK